jgi:hypothetical protein
MLINFFSFTGHHLVPKSKGENETGHGGTKKGCRKCENSDDTQELLGKRRRYECPEEEVNRSR